MKKSKHFRKDVIMARIIAGLILIVLIALIVFAVSLFTKPSDSNKNTQTTENTEGAKPGTQNTEFDDSESQDSESEEPDVDIDTESEADEKVYVKTTTQVRLRAEANTNCATLDRIDGGTKLEVLETLEGWYKVIHNGQEGYVSATYVEVVEE